MSLTGYLFCTCDLHLQHTNYREYFSTMGNCSHRDGGLTFYSWLLICFLALLNSLGDGKNLGIDQNCYTVNVSGAQLTTSINGLYYLDRELMCNSREVWIQYSGSHYLYYLSDGFYGWIIGKNTCFSHGDFVAVVKTNIDKPYNVQDAWKEYSESDVTAGSLDGLLRVDCYNVEEKGHSDRISCQHRPCFNGGTCVGVNNEYSCVCPHGFFGHRCQTAIDSNHCKSSPCQNGAQCSDLKNDFSCLCLEGFVGRTCDIISMDTPVKHVSIQTRWKVALMLFGLVTFIAFLAFTMVTSICFCRKNEQARRRSNILECPKGSFQYTELQDESNSSNDVPSVLPSIVMSSSVISSTKS